MSRKTSFVFALLLIFCGGLSAQQNAQELRLGSVISGNLRSGEEIWYSIKAVETCFLTIETIGNTDTYLEVYDNRQNKIMENDDGGSDLNARVDILAASGGSYLVKLRAYDGEEAGPFRIMSSYTPLSNIVELRLGSLMSGNLSSGQRQLYRITTAEAGLYVIETSSGLDTYIDAYDASYNHIGSDDDSGEETNARIELFAEANSTYYFLLRCYDNSESGSYRVWASYEPVIDAKNTSRSTAAALKLGEAVSVFITTADQSRWYVYEATRTATFVVQTRGNMDTRLYLYDDRGGFLQEDDDSGDNSNALISTRLNSGTYYIEVKGYSNETGRCTLHAELR